MTDPRRWRIARIVGRNPLLRRSDRIEALVMLVALVASLVAIPVAGMVGATAYGARERLYAQEEYERHRVVATVADARPGRFSSAAVQAKWPAGAGERTGTVELANPVKAGDRVEIWVDGTGAPSLPPTPAWHAVGDAVGMAGVTLVIATLAAASLAGGVRSRLGRARDAQWDREMRSLIYNGGRTNRQ